MIHSALIWSFLERWTNNPSASNKIFILLALFKSQFLFASGTLKKQNKLFQMVEIQKTIDPIWSSRHCMVLYKCLFCLQLPYTMCISTCWVDYVPNENLSCCIFYWKILALKLICIQRCSSPTPSLLWWWQTLRSVFHHCHGSWPGGMTPSLSPPPVSGLGSFSIRSSVRLDGAHMGTWIHTCVC